MNSLAVLLIAALYGSSYAFVPQSVHTKRISFVSKPFYVASTELKSDDTADAEPAVSSEDTTATEEVVAEAVSEAIDEIAQEEKSEEKRVLRERNTVFLGNLPFELTDTEISDLCSEHGTVLLVTSPKDRATGRPRGFAFVDMSTAEEMDKAISSIDGSQFKGRTLRANVSDPSQKQERKPAQKKTAESDDNASKVYVGNLPFDTDKDELLEFYREFVDATDCYIPFNADTGTGRGFGFVTVAPDDLETAIEQTNGAEFNGRPLVVSKPLPPGKKANRRPSQKDCTKLYVGNLAFSTDAEILEEVFGEFGEIVDCYMPEDPARGGSRGFGFVTMKRESALEAIAELNGCELDGRFIRVNEALPKGKSQDSGFGDDFGGDDFGSQD